jgi:hypothetical protein
MTPRSKKTNDSFDAATEATRGVEIKITVLGDQEMKAVRLFELDRSRAETRKIFFFDTPQLRLFKSGIILRARLVTNGADDSTVKFRPVDPASVGPEWKEEAGFKLEADAVGTRVVRSASLSCVQQRREIKDVAAGRRPLNKLFSSEQERFLATFAPMQVKFDQLKVLGPIEALVWKFRVKELKHEVTAEEWHLPDGIDLLELSIKVDRDKARVAQGQFERFLREVGIDHEGAQTAKTRVALEHLSGRLKC